MTLRSAESSFSSLVGALRQWAPRSSILRSAPHYIVYPSSSPLKRVSLLLHLPPCRLCPRSRHLFASLLARLPPISTPVPSVHRALLIGCNEAGARRVRPAESGLERRVDGGGGGVGRSGWRSRVRIERESRRSCQSGRSNVSPAQPSEQRISLSPPTHACASSSPSTVGKTPTLRSSPPTGKGCWAPAAYR